MKSINSIDINLDHIKCGLHLWIDSRKPGTMYDDERANLDNIEARFQIQEGCVYDFEFSDKEFTINDVGENIIQLHKRSPHIGSISPNIFVGTLYLPIRNIAMNAECGSIELEVQSIKANYREDYRYMLEYITEKCADLILRADSPVSQYLDVDFNQESKTLYQRFSFIKSIIGSDEIREAVSKIVQSPSTKWSIINENIDNRKVRKYSKTSLKSIVKESNRIGIPKGHYLNQYSLNSIPNKVSIVRKEDSVDTPENRFVKYVLESMLFLCSRVALQARTKNYKKLECESLALVTELEGYLDHQIFNNISKPHSLKINSPLLQRKDGYRQVLRVWLMCELAAKLIWKGGDDIYQGGKKDVALLYEYWIFFKLLDLFKSLFKIEPKELSEIIQASKDGFSLQIKQGRFTPLSGTFDSGSRKICIRFCYNRSFSGNMNYPNAGSWSTSLRPDYTLSFWPFGMSENEAEIQELIVHLHFDAKYKISNFVSLIDDSSPEFDEEKIENRKGIYKNADLLKMHAYKDAIRRTGGAYVLYPGERTTNHKGFHEILPGLGAFSMRPSISDSGISDLKIFIENVIANLVNRTSQREKISYRIFDIFKSPPISKNIVSEPIPESYGVNRDLLPDESFVLVGFYKSINHYKWIINNQMYNLRLNSDRGSLTLDKETIAAKYLLLHGPGDRKSNKIWKITSKGPKVYTKQHLINLGYDNPRHESYLIIEIDKITESEFNGLSWDFTSLMNFKIGNDSALPFTASLDELMQHTIRTGP